MDRTDNTLKILVTTLSILFLLIAIKTSYPADDTMDMILTISGKFLFFELRPRSPIFVNAGVAYL